MFDVSFEFDFYGNLYLIDKEDVYQVNIDNKGKPYLDKDDYRLINNREETFITYDEVNQPFEFGGSSLQDIPVKERQFGDVSALYETYIYDLKDQLMFKSTSPLNDVCYHIIIYQKGLIGFIPVGDSETVYTVTKKDDKLVFT